MTEQNMTMSEHAKKTDDWEMAEFYKFAEEFSGETDRAAVILGAAKLDILLFQLLQKVIRPCTSKIDELLEGDSPLGTFSARAMICHRLGLIDDEIYKSINLVRRIRNSFAHELSGVSLETGAHRDRIRELCAPLKEHGAFKWLLNDIYKKNQGPSNEFRAAVALLALRLEGAFENMAPIYNRNPMSLVPPSWDKDETKLTSTTELKPRKTGAKRKPQ
jgi:hypothetical protein